MAQGGFGQRLSCLGNDEHRQFCPFCPPPNQPNQPPNANNLRPLLFEFFPLPTVPADCRHHLMLMTSLMLISLVADDDLGDLDAWLIVIRGRPGAVSEDQPQHRGHPSPPGSCQHHFFRHQHQYQLQYQHRKVVNCHPSSTSCCKARSA